MYPSIDVKVILDYSLHVGRVRRVGERDDVAETSR